MWDTALRPVMAMKARLSASSFTRNVSMLLISTVLGQAASVLLSPLLTRIFSPEQFGDLSIYSSILLTFSGAACLRYEIVIPTARTEADATTLIAATGVALACVTICFAAGCWLVPDSLLDRLSLGLLTRFRALLPLGLLSIGLFTLLSYAGTWTQDFQALSKARVSQGFAGPLSQIALGLLGFGSFGLALGFVVGQTAGTSLLAKRLIVDRWAALRTVTWPTICHALWRYRSYPLISAWATVIDALGSGALLYLFVARYYPGSVAGFLFLSERIVARPLLMVSNSMLTVFMSELGRFNKTDPQRLSARFRQITSKQFLIGIAWIITVNIGAVTALGSVFGSAWAEAVPYLVTISLCHLATNVIQSVSNTLQVLNRQVVAASWQVGRVIAIVLGFWLCHRAGEDALTAIAVYSSVQVVACIIMYFMIRDSIDRLGRPAPGLASP